jgi:hypothetical protein
MRLPATLGALYLSIVSLCAQDVSSPQKRNDSLDLARKLLTSKPVHIDAAEVMSKNPFNPQAPVPEAVEATPSSPVVIADRDLLAALSSGLSPSGAIRMGDTQYLLFGQKKFKVGDVLPIVFQGVTHELVVADIQQTSFTLRLKNEEITRPIKPSANKP